MMGNDNISSDLIRGHIDTMILSVLFESDNYGYEIIKAIWKRSHEEYELKEPSLYTSLKRLEKQGFVESYWGDESQGGRRKYYRITNTGTSALQAAIAAWQSAQQIINSILLGGYDHG